MSVSYMVGVFFSIVATFVLVLNLVKLWTGLSIFRTMAIAQEKYKLDVYVETYAITLSSTWLFAYFAFVR